MQHLRADIRSSIFDTYKDMADMLREQRGSMNFYDQLVALRNQVKLEPNNDDLADQLRSVTRSKVDADLIGLHRDQATEAHLEQVLLPQNPAQRAAFNATTLEEAEQLIALAQPVREVTDAALFGTAMLHESLKRFYAQLLQWGPNLDILHRNTGTVLRATAIGQITPQLIIKELDLALETAKVAIASAQLGGRFDEARDLPTLIRISDEAKMLKQESNLLQLPQPVTPPDHD